jgi:hypothetical protein
MWPREVNALAVRILQHKTVRFQVTVLFQEADPIFLATTEDGNEIFRQIPTVKQDYAERQFPSNRGFHEFRCERDFSLKLLVQGLKLRIGEEHRINGFMERRAFLLPLGNLAVGKVLMHELFPAGHFFITPIEPQVHGKAHGTTHVMAGDGIMGQGIGVIAMIVMAVNVLEQTPNVFA